MCKSGPVKVRVEELKHCCQWHIGTSWNNLAWLNMACLLKFIGQSTSPAKHPFKILIHSFIHSFVYSFICPLINHSFIHLKKKKTSTEIYHVIHTSVEVAYLVRPINNRTGYAAGSKGRDPDLGSPTSLLLTDEVLRGNWGSVVHSCHHACLSHACDLWPPVCRSVQAWWQCNQSRIESNRKVGYFIIPKGNYLAQSGMAYIM